MRIAVTGGAGFIGSHLCERLLSGGHRVVGIDSFDDFYDPALKRRNFARLAPRQGFEPLEVDARNREALRPALVGVDAVIHLAARPGVRPSFAIPDVYTEANVTATGVLLGLMDELSIPRLVFASSSSVYGEGATAPFREHADLGTPKSPYAATKLAGEMLCRAFSHRVRHIVILRLFSVYGPRQRPDLALHKFARRIHAGEPVPVLGSLDSYRDYTFVDDIVTGIEAALQVEDPFTILNLGRGHPVTLGDMLRHLEAAFGREVEREMLPAHPGDLFGTWADTAAAQHVLGFSPSWSFRDGVRRFVDWFLESERQRSQEPAAQP